MKKILAVLLTIALIVPCITVPTFAASTEALVRYLHFTVDSSMIDVGTDPDGLDYSNVKIVCTDEGCTWDSKTNKGTFSNTSEYPGLTVRIADLQGMNSDKTALKIGSTVKYKFWVEISGYKTITSGTTTTKEAYYVSSSTNMKVAASEKSTGPRPKSVSKSRSSSDTMTVTVTTYPLKGQYTQPENLEWKSGSLGQATWTAPEDENGTGYYDVKLLRNGSSVYTETKYHGTSFNFYPWMTKEGDYSFRVRTVPNSDSSSSSGKASEWNESDSQEVPKEKVSDGTGQTSGGGQGGSTSGKVGWVQVNDKWYFYYPDGTMKKNGWEKIQNKWYLFDASGMMLVGWQTYKNNTYYLDPSKGDMKTGWVKTNDGQWYYLNPNPNVGTEGAMLKNTFLDSNGYRYYLTSTGAMATGWTKIDSYQYYFKPNDGGPKGAMVTNQRIDGFWLGADGRWVQGQ